MNKIDKLIQELCPGGVEFKKNKQVCIALTKETLTKSEVSDETNNFPVINSGRGIYGYYTDYNNTGPAFTVAARGEYAGFVNFFDTNFWAGGLCYPYKSKDENIILTKFIYYYLKSQQKSIMSQYVFRGSIPAINKQDLDNVMIPIPPIKVQNKIVNILDKFVKLEAELEAELDAREQQYEFYRGTIFNPITKCAKLKKIAKLKNGKDWKHLNRGKYPVYGTGGVMEYVDEYVYNKPTVLIPRKGSINNVFYIDEPFWNIDTIYYAEINESLIIPKYFYYFITSIDLTKLDTGSGRPSLTQSILNEIDVPLPALEEQNKIISVLDKFEKLINDITIGLPAEIEMRKKQYEYYRDKLLTFEVLNNE